MYDKRGYYENGYARVRSKNYTGFVDENNNIIIPIEYAHCEDFVLVSLLKYNNKILLMYSSDIDYTNHTIFDENFQEFEMSLEHCELLYTLPTPTVVVYKNNDEHAMYNTNGDKLFTYADNRVDYHILNYIKQQYRIQKLKTLV